MTTRQVRAELKPLGITLQRMDGQSQRVYRVNTLDGGEATSFTGSLKDCLETGLAMARLQCSFVITR
jgi:hypothetical protein